MTYNVPIFKNLSKPPEHYMDICILNSPTHVWRNTKITV